MNAREIMEDSGNLVIVLSDTSVIAWNKIPYLIKQKYPTSEEFVRRLLNDQTDSAVMARQYASNILERAKIELRERVGLRGAHITSLGHVLGKQVRRLELRKGKLAAVCGCIGLENIIAA